MRTLVDDVLVVEPDAVIPWTGRQMAVAKLGRPALVEHSVGELGEILLRAGRDHDPCPDDNLAVRLRSPGEPDLRVLVEHGTAGLVWADDAADEPAIEIDAPARHLFIWGRRPRHPRADPQPTRPSAARPTADSAVR
jgi:hypothetical protein